MLTKEQIKFEGETGGYRKLAAAVIEGAMKEFKYMSQRKPEMDKYNRLIGEGVQEYAAAKAAGAWRPQYWKRLCDRYEETKSFILGPTPWHNILGLESDIYKDAVHRIEMGTDGLGEVTNTAVGGEAI